MRLPFRFAGGAIVLKESVISMRVAKEFWVPLRVAPRSPQNDDSPLPARHILRTVFDLAGTFVPAVALLVLFSVFLVRPVTVFGSSMLPTLRDRQRVAVTAFTTAGLKHGSIVVVSDAGTDMPIPEPIIKRVVGLPGDVIDIDFDAHIVYRNGQALSEPYIAEPTARRDDFGGPVTVPAGAVFLMGDNRNHSMDSRSARVGFVDQRYLLGRVLFK